MTDSHSVTLAIEIPPASELLERIGHLSRMHFTEMPQLLTTDRTGRFEQGWVRHGSQWLAVSPASMAPEIARNDAFQMAMLLGQYAGHPDANPLYFSRSAQFPRSIELHAVFI